MTIIVNQSEYDRVQKHINDLNQILPNLEPLPENKVSSPKRKRKVPVSNDKYHCVFIEAWRGKCNRASSQEYCAAHVNLTCAYCEKQATRNCHQTGYGGVCGELQCDDHKNYCRLN